MENEEKKDVAPKTKPEPSPEEAARKLRDRNDLRTFAIAVIAAIVVVSGYHIGRQLIRVFVTQPRAAAARRAALRRHHGPKPCPGEFKPCCCRRKGPGEFKPRRRGPHFGPKRGPKPGMMRPDMKKPDAPKPPAPGPKACPEAKKAEAPKPQPPAPTAPEKK